jgi:maltose alpha-D-glucosyltransferase / alpha-amylase
MLDFWYKNAVLYELDVKTFQDGDGDGWGDFPGLTRRLPYLAGLGVTCLWLRPFYPSPLRDDGYDVTDFYAIDPRLGTFGDFVVFLRAAGELGVRVIADLVVNHTSDQHPWFRSARSDPASPYREYYLWATARPADDGPIVFPGVQDHTWSYDEAAGAYYHHRFYPCQPDLNTANPAVREEIGKVMSFWLRLGLSGFRLDAAPFLIEHVPAAEPGEETAFVTAEPDGVDGPFALLRELRRALSWLKGDAVFLAEANVPADQALDFFGPDGDRMHLLFNFLLNQHLFLALARQEATPLGEILARLPDLPPGGQWLNFLRNHDEIDLGRLTEKERAEAYAAFAPRAEMRAYGRGVRRRLAPMLGGDRRRVELAHALMLSLPGAPLIRQGEEIGMGDDLSLPERFSVRTPMQWSAEPNAGFSAAPPDRLIRPVISGGGYGYERVNVAAEQCDSDSLLNRIERLIRVRKGCVEFAHGRLQVLDVADRAVFAHRCEAHGGAVVGLHNLAGRPAVVTVEVDGGAGERLADLFGDGAAEDGVRQPIELPPYGYRWFRVVGGRWRSR